MDHGLVWCYSNTYIPFIFNSGIMMQPFKRLNKIKIGVITFDIIWDKKEAGGGAFDFFAHKIIIGCDPELQEETIFATLCHEIMEIVSCIHSVRLIRPDFDSDYIFVYDHRQFHIIMDQFTGIITQFL